MTVDELIVYLQELSKEGKGHYVVVQDGYARDLMPTLMTLDENKEELWM